MNRTLTHALYALELIIPIAGITRMGSRRAVAVILATVSHIVPFLGCVFAGWDPVTILLVYWINLAMVIAFILLALIVLFAFRVAGGIRGVRSEGFELPGIIERSGGGYGVLAGFLAVWCVLFGGMAGANLQVLGAIAQSHYGLDSLSSAYDNIARGFLPPRGGLSAFFGSESASLVLMALSSAVSLYLQFFSGKGDSRGKGTYIFVVKPLVRVMVMMIVFGFASLRLPAVATVAAMALAMALIDQRIEMIDHDFGPHGKGDARFSTPQGALMNFGFQIFLILISSSFFISSVFTKMKYDRIMNNPVTVSGRIIDSRIPDEEENRTLFGGYWWMTDVVYSAQENPGRPYFIRDVKVHILSQSRSRSDPKGGIITVFYERGVPYNSFADVPEDRNKPVNMFYLGLFLFTAGLAAWWAIGRFFRF